MVKKASNNQTGDWQKADARVLGQILAAQNILFALSDPIRIAEFYAQTLISIPGIAACRVCLGDRSVQAGQMETGGCAECETMRHKASGGGKVFAGMPGFECSLVDDPDMRFVSIDSHEHHFGSFTIKINNYDVFKIYDPFIRNLSSYVAITLESRVQKDLLQEAHDELELKVQERTHELTVANERFSLAARTARVGVWDWDIQKNELVWDEGMYPLYGIKKEDFAGAYEAWLNGVHPDDRARSEEISKLSREGEREYDTEFRVVWPDGSIHFLKAYGNVTRDAEGRPLRMTGVNFDITDQKQLEETISRLAAIVESSDDAIISKTLNGDIVSWNVGAEKLYGYKAEEVVGKSTSILLPPDRPDELPEILAKIGRREVVSHFETVRRTKNGRIIDVSLTVSPIKNQAGEILGASSIAHDITERKQEENVRLARLRLMEFADTHSLEDLLQATLDEVEALTGSSIGFYHFVDSDQRTLWLQSWSTRTLREMCTAEGKGLHYDVNEAGVWVDCVHERKPVIHNDYSALPHRRGMPVGHAKVIRELVVPVFRGDRIVAILGVGNKAVNYVQDDVEIVSLLADLAWDIAERKLADENLRRSEAKFLDLYENAPCAYFSVGTDAIIRLCNRRAEELLGYSREELIGKPVLELYADRPEGKEKAEDVFRRFLAGEHIADEELHMQKADGSAVWISLTVNGVRDADGYLIESRSMVIDITERKRVEERLHLLDFASDHVREAAFLIDENALLRFVNEGACRALGYKRSELLGSGVSAVDPDFPVDRWKGHWNDLKAQGSLIFESRHKTKDGHLFPVEINANYFEYGGQGYNLALVRDITERKQAEEDRLANLRFLESMDQINRAIQGTNDLEQMMSDVLDVVLSIFDCDRAWLFYPCDPEAPSFRVPMEISKPDYPGAKTLNVDLPMPEDMAQNLREALDSVGPVTYSAGTERPINKVSADQFGVKSMMMLALHPKVDKPWAFGLHQCSYPRGWTHEEERLFQEIGRRLGDALTTLLTYRNLQESEAKLAEAERIAHVGYWERDLDADSINLSEEAYRIFGLLPAEHFPSLAQWHRRWLQLIHPEDRSRISKAADDLMRSGSEYDVEYRAVQPDGEVRIVHAQGRVVRDESGRPRRAFGTMQDITEHKRSEEALRRLNRELRAISNCNQALLRAVDEQALVEDVCRIVCDEAAYRLAWVGYAENDAAKTVLPVAWAGVENGYVSNARLTWADDTERGQGPAGRAIRSGETVCVQDVANDPQMAPWRERALQIGCRSVLALPLKDERARVLGVLLIYHSEAQAITPDEIQLMEQLAGDLAFGIVALRIRAERKSAEEALIESEAKYRRIVDTATEGIWVVGPDTMTTFVNARMAEMLGYQVEEMIGHPLTAFMFTEDGPDYHRKMEARRQGVSENYERRFRRKDEQTVWTFASATPIIDDEHCFNGAFAMFTDITERKQAEESLSEKSQFIDSLLRAAPVAIFYKDREGRYIGCNDAFTDIMGVSSEEMRGKTVHELWPSELADKYHQKDLELMRNREHQEYEFLVKAKDGEIHPVIYAKDVYFDSHGEVAGLVGAFLDITERKRAERELQQSNDLLRAIIEAAPTAIIGLDLDGNVHSVWNQSAERMLGWGAEEVMGRPLPSVPAESRQQFAGFRDRIRRGLTLDGIEVRRQRRDGTPIDYSIYAAPLHDTKGQITGNVAVLVDITERKRADKELRIQKERFQMLSDNAPFGMVMIGEDGTFLYANPKFTEIVGYDLSDVPNGREWFRKAHPNREYRHSVISTWKEDWEQHLPGETRSRVFLVTCKHGDQKVIRFRPVKLSTDEDLMTLEDITERVRAEEKVQEQIEFLNTVLESLTHPFYVIDANDYTVITANSASGLDLSKGERTCYALTHQRSDPCNASDHQCPLEVVRLTRKPATVEHIHHDRYGNPRILEIHAYPILDNRGNVHQIIEYALDITERKRVEEALRASEERYRTLFERTRDSIMIIDIEGENAGQIVHANPVAAEMHGYDLEELLALKIGDLDTPESAEKVPERIERIFNGEWVREEAGHIRKDGSFFPIEISASALELGNHKYALAIDRDISYRKQAEEALRRSEELLRLVFENVRSGFLVLDGQRKIVMLNEYGRSCLGLEDDILGQDLLQLFPDLAPFLSDARPSEQKMVQAAMSDGKTKYLGFNSRALPDETTRIVLFRDITLIMENEKRMRRAEQLAVVGEMAARLSHEIKNPLASILLGLQTVERGTSLSEEDRFALQLVLQEVNGLNKSIGQILEAARSVPLRATLVQVEPLLRSCFDVHNLMGTNMGIVMELVQGPDDAMIIADHAALRRIVTNLIQNALEACKRYDAVRLGWRTIGEEEKKVLAPEFSGPIIGMFVEDTGPGLPEGVAISTLMDAFFTTKEGGTGLGLAIANDVVERHGGIIKANRVAGVTRFEVLMPAGDRPPCWELRHKVSYEGLFESVDCDRCAVRSVHRGYFCWSTKGEGARAESGRWPNKCIRCTVFRETNLNIFVKSE